MTLLDGRIVANPGSVGLPAYEDDLPSCHVVETSTPHARYLIAERTDTGWDIELVPSSSRPGKPSRRTGRPGRTRCGLAELSAVAIRREGERQKADAALTLP